MRSQIKHGRWKREIEEIRGRYDETFKKTGSHEKAKRAVDALKKKLPGILWSGTFTRRDKENLKRHSGLLCIDIDGLNSHKAEVRQKLCTSPHLYFLHDSPTDQGYKAVFAVVPDASKQPGSFRALKSHIRELADVEVDEKAKDLARMSFASWDPSAFYNPDPKQIEPLPEPEKPPQPVGNVNIPADLPLRERIATGIFGPLTWSEEKQGFFCKCPGKAAHTTLTALRHTMVYLDRVPTFDCKHSSCKDIQKAFNARLRSEIGKAEFAAQNTQPITESKTVEPSASEAEEETFQRLAALPPIEYDRVRISEAGRLGCRAATLDAYVESRRLALNSGLQGRAMELPDVELWPEPVNGAGVLNETSKSIAAYVVLPKSAADVCAVWCAHAHAFRAFACSPRLHITSPEKGCGKTTSRDVLALHTPRWLLAENLSVAVLFRVIEKFRPTLFADECDTWLRDNDELRGMLNAGHRRGGQALRCEGESNEVRAFNVFAPVCLCGIGALPGTLHDRSIQIRLERAKPGEILKRFDSNHVEPEKILCRKIARFCADNMAKIEACDPKLPDGVFNRLADNWRPLFAIAEVAGGDWSQRVASALFELTNDDDVTAQGIGTILLSDIREIFANQGADRLHSETIATQLAAIEGRSWAEFGKSGKPISKNQVAKQLRHFNIEPRDVRIGDAVLKGYLLEHFKEAFERYLPADPPFQSATPL